MLGRRSLEVEPNLISAVFNQFKHGDSERFMENCSHLGKNKKNDKNDKNIEKNLGNLI